MHMRMKTSNWPSVVLCVLALAMANGAKADDPKSNNDPSVEKISESTGLSGAALAARLALEGESLRSPMMLLTAADILDGLQSSERSAEGVKSKSDGEGAQKDHEKSAPTLDPIELRKRALELASSDSEREILQQWLDRPAPRGLIFSQGKNLESVEIEGVTFKLVDSGVLRAGQTQTLSNVIFEGKKPAIVLVIGDGDGDLDLWVYDENTKGLIGKDTDSTSLCRVAWTPRYEGPFIIKVTNVGNIAERYLVLANW